MIREHRSCCNLYRDELALWPTWTLLVREPVTISLWSTPELRLVSSFCVSLFQDAVVSSVKKSLLSSVCRLIYLAKHKGVAKDATTTILLTVLLSSTLLTLFPLLTLDTGNKGLLNVFTFQKLLKCFGISALAFTYLSSEIQLHSPSLFKFG